jgi:mannosyltransferase OCH1-like enzyme
MRIPIRVSFIVGGIALLALLVHVISRLLFFRSLFYEHSGIRITQPEIAAAFTKDHGANRTQHIPKIIHHIFHNWREPEKDGIPDGWGEMRKGCMELNPDFEFKVGTNFRNIDIGYMSY